MTATPEAQLEEAQQHITRLREELAALQRKLDQKERLFVDLERLYDSRAEELVLVNRQRDKLRDSVNKYFLELNRISEPLLWGVRTVHEPQQEGQ